MEVKGYYDDKDLAKWNCFTKKIFILDAKFIKLIDKNEFTKDHIVENKKEFL